MTEFESLSLPCALDGAQAHNPLNECQVGHGMLYRRRLSLESGSRSRKTIVVKGQIWKNEEVIK